MRVTQIARETAQRFRAGRRIVPGIRILAYHGVVERRLDERVEQSFHLVGDLRAQIRVLQRCEVVSLGDPDVLRPRRRPSLRPRVVITFDDGFRNNVMAAELLAAARLPFTIFVATSNVSEGRTIWPTLLRLVLARGSARTYVIGGERYDLATDPTAFGRIRTAFKKAPTPKRYQLWDELVAHLGDGELDDLISQFPSIAMMTWSDVKALSANGANFGSHGYAHELHHAAQPPALREKELARSKLDIEQALGRPCWAFAFPNGTTCADSALEARAAGYSQAFTMVSRAVGRDEEPMLLPRIMPGPTEEKLALSLMFGS